jgi:hypothetical protein
MRREGQLHFGHSMWKLQHIRDMAPAGAGWCSGAAPNNIIHYVYTDINYSEARILNYAVLSVL